MAAGLWRSRRTLVVAGTATLVLVLVVAASLTGSLRAQFHLDERAYRPGESVPFSLSVCSGSLLPMWTDDGKPSWRITNSAGHVVADSSHQVFTLELKRLSWSPRQCRLVLSVDWDQREWNQRALDAGESAGVPRRGAPMPPGEYAVEVTWGALTPSSATFEISE